MLPQIRATFAKLPAELSLVLSVTLAFFFLVDYQPLIPSWDDTFFLHRATCANQGFFRARIDEVWGCLSAMHKSPLMALASIPMGSIAGTLQGLSLIFPSLVLMQFLLVALICRVARQAQISPILTVLSFAALAASSSVRSYASVLYVDPLLSLLVAATMLLIRLECMSKDALSDRDSILRGIFWGFLVGLGLLAKITYGYFLLFIVPPVIWARLGRGSVRSLGLSLTSATIAALPGLATLFVLREQILRHATGAVSGLTGSFYGDGRGYFGFLLHFTRVSGFYPIVILILMTLVITMNRSVHRKIRLIEWIPLASCLVYLGLFGLSENHDIRFGLPALYGLPLAIAALSPISPEQSASAFKTRAIACLVSAFFALLVVWPLRLKLNLSYIEMADQILGAMPKEPTRLMVASDSPWLNIETLTLAKQLGAGRYSQLSFDSTVYDLMNGIGPDESIAKLGSADVALFHEDPLPREPEFTNRYSAEQRAFAETHGTRLAFSTAGITLFKLGR